VKYAPTEVEAVASFGVTTSSATSEAALPINKVVVPELGVKVGAATTILTSVLYSVIDSVPGLVLAVTTTVQVCVPAPAVAVAVSKIIANLAPTLPVPLELFKVKFDPAALAAVAESKLATFIAEVASACALSPTSETRESVEVVVSINTKRALPVAEPELLL